jgi:hypothetical protein
MASSSVSAKRLPAAARQLLQQPTAISAIASLGMHALLFVLLPILPYAALTEAEPEIRRSVEVVELTPEEQNRLPEFSSAQVDLPPLFPDSPTGDLPPLPLPKPSTPPPADGLFSDPFFNTPIPNFSFPIFPQSVPLPPPVAQQPPKPPEPAPPQTAPSLQPEAQPSPEGDRPTITLRPGGLPILPEGSENPAAPTQPPSDRLNPPQSDDRVAANPESTAESPAAPAEPSPQARSDEEIVAALRQDVEARRQEIFLQRQLAYNPAGTDQDPNYNPGSAWAQWMQSLEESGVNLSNVGDNSQFPQTAIEIPFPEAACEAVEQDVSAVFGVVVNGEGAPVGDYAVLRSSGYEYFNTVGGESILASTFENPAGKDLPYQITVTFPYSAEACASSEPNSEPGNEVSLAPVAP